MLREELEKIITEEYAEELERKRGVVNEEFEERNKHIEDKWEGNQIFMEATRADSKLMLEELFKLGLIPKLDYLQVIRPYLETFIRVGDEPITLTSREKFIQFVELINQSK